ncbi:DUF1758 domain-containing protein [Trichonephila clavata]|uniref:DUF1758 domain-containing protein n=1 Tax=Trichonephila clavata TaxID=2740835 RepID=A0A8X6KI70_TRICU|nr:DUF1758 domain-containing protein [Trichonephila clavata]
MNSTESAKRSSGNRPNKRKFTGNMYTRGKAVHSVHESLNNSASGKKIQLQDVDSSFIENNDGFDGYRVFDKYIMFTNIQNFASCKKCGGDITLKEQCVRGCFGFIISICEEKDEETYCTEKDDILDMLEAILVTIDTQLVPSVINSDLETINKGSSQTSISAQSAEVKLPTLSLPIFSGVTEEWLCLFRSF